MVKLSNFYELGLYIASISLNARNLNQYLNTDRKKMYSDTSDFITIEKQSITIFIHLMNFLKLFLKTLNEEGISPLTQNEIKPFLEKYKNKYEGIDSKLLDNKTFVLHFFDNFYLDQLNNQIKIWKDRIENEIPDIRVIKVISQGHLDLKHLLEGAEKFIQPEVWGKMSDNERNDLKDCVLCITTGAWTPAGMIAMRVVESAVRKYYTLMTNDPNPPMNWNEIIKQLESNSNADKKLLGYLSYLKDVRNKLEHPDKRIDVYEAEETFLHTTWVLKIIHS